MTSSIATTLQLILEGAWRRRTLMMGTTGLVFILGVIFVIASPRTYIAKSLMLLQETGGDLPTPRDLGAAARLQDRVAGLRALLKSDLVLYSVMLDIEGEKAPTKPREIAVWIRDFSAALSLELVGADFLEFQLKGSTPLGMGKQLESVTSRFLEALLSTQDAMNATQVLLDRRKEDYETATRAYTQFKETIADQLPPSYERDMAELTQQTKRLQTLTWELSKATVELQRIRGAVRDDGSAKQGKLDPSRIADRPTRAPQSHGVVTSAEAGSLAAQPTTAKPSDIEHAERRVASLQGEIEKITRNVDSIQRAVSGFQPIEKQLKSLQASVQKAKQDYDSYAQRFTAQPSAARAHGLLRAPERIKLIDAPRDPEFATQPRIKLVAAALVLALALGMAAVLAAEMLDQTVRRNEQLEALTGVPVIARLPRA